MSRISKSLCWATAILLVALGNRLGLIGDKTASVLLVVLPIAAVMSLNRNDSCDLRRPGAGA